MNYYLSKFMMYHLVHQRDYEGFSITKIAEEFGINWRTTKRMLSMSELEYATELEKSKGRRQSLQTYEQFVKEKLTAYPETSAAQMHDWLKEHHADFPAVTGRTVFNFVYSIRDRYNIPRTEPIREYACVPELDYGLQGQVDFGFYTMKTTLGKTRKVQFFTFVLSRSRYKYILFSDTPFTTASVIAAHEKAFEFLKGRPVEIVYDQDRLFLVDENLGDLIMTAQFRLYVKESGFTTWFCRKADPESKGKVENVVKYVKQNFLYNRSFKDLETLNDEVFAWLFRTANALVHGTTRKEPRLEYAIESEFLREWKPYRTEQPECPLYSVRKDNTISWKSNLYSLPLGTYKGKGTQVFLKATLDQIILLNQKKEELCRHPICTLKGQKILQTDHLRDKRRMIGEMMEEFCELMENKPLALDWISQLKDAKPRYIRDQIQLLKTTMATVNTVIASKTLEYCSTNKIVSAVDFRTIAEAFLRESAPAEQQEVKIIPMNPLNGEMLHKAQTDPQKSDMDTYEAFFSGD